MDEIRNRATIHIDAEGVMNRKTVAEKRSHPLRHKDVRPKWRPKK